jgi:GntR family transcriptional repressor for pyruvate dehydrogenase complex
MKQASLKLKPVPNGDKIEQIITVLQNYIIDGKLKPGDGIPPERQLASQLGVSRFSLREALRVAQTQGLIEISRGRRPQVAKPSATAAANVIALTLRRSGKILLDLIEARQALECQIARLAAARAQQSHIAAIQQTIEAMEQNKNNLTLCVEKDVEFHNILVEASGNKVFEIMLAPLSELLRKSRKETMRANGVQRAIVGHKLLLSAVIEKDSDKAAEAMYRHLEMAEEDLKRIKENENV